MFEPFNPFNEYSSLEDSANYSDVSSDFSEPLLWKHAVSLVKERKQNDFQMDLLWEWSNSINHDILKPKSPFWLKIQNDSTPKNSHEETMEKFN